MNADTIDILQCPKCAAAFDVFPRNRADDRIVDGTLKCKDNGHEFPISGGITSFVPEENYADNFGFQWNKFSRTQLDSYSGTTISRDRFIKSTGWGIEKLNGARVLDVGCGAGRFAEIALSFGAHVVAVDYSSAVSACLANNDGLGKLDVIRADIYQMPFKDGVFDFVYCLGVLQHTPDVRRAFLALERPLARGGELAVDVYGASPLQFFDSRHWIRPITKRMDRHVLFGMVEKVFVPVLLPLSRAIGRVPRVGRRIRRLVPVSNYEGILPLDGKQLREWAILDTYDMLAPVYDQPQSADTLRDWFIEANLHDVEVFRAGHLIGRGRKEGI